MFTVFTCLLGLVCWGYHGARKVTEVRRGALQGKIGRDDLAGLCVHLLESSAATDRTFEVRSTVPFSEPWTDEQSAAAAARDWEGALLEAELKRGVTGKTVKGIYTGRDAESPSDVKAPAAKALAKS